MYLVDAFILPRRGWIPFQRDGYVPLSSDRHGPGSRQLSAPPDRCPRDRPISDPLPQAFSGAQRPHSSRWNNTFYSLRLLWFPGFHLSFCADHTVTFCQTESHKQKKHRDGKPITVPGLIKYYQSSRSAGLRSVRKRRSARSRSPWSRTFSRSVIRTGSSFMSLRIHSSAMPTNAYL